MSRYPQRRLQPKPPISSDSFVSPPRSRADATYVANEPTSSFNTSDRNARISIQEALLQAPDSIGHAIPLLHEDAVAPSDTASFSGTQQIDTLAWGSQLSNFSQDGSSIPPQSSFNTPQRMPMQSSFNNPQRMPMQSSFDTPQRSLADPLGPTLDNYIPLQQQPAHSQPHASSQQPQMSQQPPMSQQPQMNPQIVAMSQRVAADSYGTLFTPRQADFASAQTDPERGARVLRRLVEKYREHKLALINAEAAFSAELDRPTTNAHLVDCVYRIVQMRGLMVRSTGLMAAQTKVLRPDLQVETDGSTVPDTTQTPAPPTTNPNPSETLGDLGMSDFNWGMYRPQIGAI